MRRREFITLLGGAAAVWPLTVRAQKPERMRHVGVHLGFKEGDPEAQPLLVAFQQGLEELGWIDGRNICRGCSSASSADVHARWT